MLISPVVPMVEVLLMIVDVLEVLSLVMTVDKCVVCSVVGFSVDVSFESIVPAIAVRPKVVK